MIPDEVYLFMYVLDWLKPLVSQYIIHKIFKYTNISIFNIKIGSGQAGLDFLNSGFLMSLVQLTHGFQPNQSQHNKSNEIIFFNGRSGGRTNFVFPICLGWGP